MRARTYIHAVTPASTTRCRALLLDLSQSNSVRTAWAKPRHPIPPIAALTTSKSPPQNVPIPRPNPPLLHPNLASPFPQHRSTSPRPPRLRHSNDPNGKTQTHVRPQHRLRRLRRLYLLLPPPHNRQETGSEKILLSHNAAGIIEGDDNG